MLKKIVSLVFGLGLFPSAAANSQVLSDPFVVKPCPNIRVESPSKIKFTDTEESLLCGSQRNPGWESVPLVQAQYFLRIFLETRGYWNHTVTIETDGVLARSGKIIHLKSATVSESPIEITMGRYWYPWGKPLTPKIVDQMESWVKEQLANEGYPCAKITGKANILTGKVDLTAESGHIAKINEIESDGIPGILGGVERRYDAFDIGDTYDSTKFRLTSSRLIANDLVVSSTFTPNCNKNGKLETIEHSLLAGAPRLVSFGVGFDTEQYAIANALWKNGRLFKNGSPLIAQTSVSYIGQSAGISWNWYYLPFPFRHYLDLSAKIRRTNERRFEERSVKISVHPSWHGDVDSVHYLVSSGLSYELIASPRGVSKDTVRLVTWDTDITLTTHDFEYFRASPQDGHAIDISHSTSDVDFGSNVTASTWKIGTTHLRNLADWSPAIFIFGIRSEFATTRPGEDTNAEDLPSSYRHHLGGSGDLRGFGRNAVPNTDLGGLSSGYLGSEFRLNNVVAYKVQPFVFADWGLLGVKPWDLALDTKYWSPGLGARWESPFGSMRFNFGYGFIDGEKEEELAHLSRWQFYFSFGEQF